MRTAHANYNRHRAMLPPAKATPYEVSRIPDDLEDWAPATRARIRTPEQALAIVVIEMAISDWLNPHALRETFDTADAFLFREVAVGSYSFEYLCAALALDADALRLRLREYAPRRRWEPVAGRRLPRIVPRENAAPEGSERVLEASPCAD